MTIGQRVKQKRIELKLNQSELADLVGMRQQSISDLENDIIKQPKKIIVLASVLKVDPEWLYKGSNPKN